MILREFAADDVDNLTDLDADSEVTRYINGGKSTPREFIEETVMPHIFQFYKNEDGQGIWAAIHKQTGEFMGWFHLRPNRAKNHETELGYRFKRKFWGQGYATEGSSALVNKGFTDLQVDVIVAIADPANSASRRVMEKAGLRYEKEYMEPDGFTVVKYRLERNRFLAMKGSSTLESCCFSLISRKNYWFSIRNNPKMLD